MKEPKNIITVADLLRLVMDNKLSLETVIVADEEDYTARLFQTAVVNRGKEDSQPSIELC